MASDSETPTHGGLLSSPVLDRCGIYRATQLFRTESDVPDPGYFGDLRRNSSGCSAAARMADADRSTLKRSSALAICTYDDGDSWDQGTLDASVFSAAGGAFLLASCGETHSALIITGEIRLETYSLVSEVRALEGPPFCRGIRW